jgi:hypothetical protein
VKISRVAGGSVVEYKVRAGSRLGRVVGSVLEPPADAWDGIIHFNKK